MIIHNILLDLGCSQILALKKKKKWIIIAKLGTQISL